MDLKFEVINESHRKDVINIFNYYIKNSTAAYRDVEVEYQFFDNLIDDCIDDFKYVILKDEEVIGFCFLEYFMPISTFREVAEVSYFLNKDFLGKGIGKMALNRLENDARKIGKKLIVANITSDNDQSIRFHEKNGFSKYGELKRAGIKFDKPFNIIYMSKILK